MFVTASYSSPSLIFEDNSMICLLECSCLYKWEFLDQSESYKRLAYYTAVVIVTVNNATVHKLLSQHFIFFANGPNTLES